MDISYFTLTDGVLELYSDRIIIFDKAKRRRIATLFLSISQLVLSLIWLLRGIKESNNYWLFLGIILTIFWLILIIIQRKDFSKVDNEIYLDDISDVAFKNSNYNTTTFTLTTRNKKVRKVVMENSEKIPVEFENKLKELHISITRWS